MHSTYLLYRKNSFIVKIVLTIFLIMMAMVANAQTDTAASKMVYNLFNPTAKDLMQEFATNRREATELNTIEIYLLPESLLIAL